MRMKEFEAFLNVSGEVLGRGRRRICMYHGTDKSSGCALPLETRSRSANLCLEAKRPSCWAGPNSAVRLSSSPYENSDERRAPAAPLLGEAVRQGRRRVVNALQLATLFSVKNRQGPQGRSGTDISTTGDFSTIVRRTKMKYESGRGKDVCSRATGCQCNLD